jgi:hypothetical protein
MDARARRLSPDRSRAGKSRKRNLPSGHGRRRLQEPRGKQRGEATLDAMGYNIYRKRKFQIGSDAKNRFQDIVSSKVLVECEHSRNSSENSGSFKLKTMSAVSNEKCLS